MPFFSGDKILIEIKTLKIIKGEMHMKQLKKVMQWAKENEELLLAELKD